MECKQCHEVYSYQFTDDFVNGICLPCQVQNRHDKWWASIQKELTAYNAAFKTDYDFNSFSFDSSIGIVNYKRLSDYPELKKVCKYEFEYWEEYRQQCLQPELPF